MLVILPKLVEIVTTESTGWNYSNDRFCEEEGLGCCWNYDGNDSCLVELVGSWIVDDKGGS